MAYVANKQQPNQVQGMNVLNPSGPPGAQGNNPSANAQNPPLNAQQAQPGTTPQGAPGMPSNPQPGANNAQPAQPAGGGSAPATRAPKTASSGSFTNLRQYMEANKPQAEKISSAVSGQFQNQAQKVQTQAQNKAAQTGAQVQQRQAQLESEKQAARDVSSGILGGGATPTEEQYNQIRGTITGERNVDDVQDLNLAQEQFNAAKLAEKAGTVGTEAGRTALLGETFNKKGRDYTRGQQGLDTLVLQGSDTARKNLIEGVQGAAKGADAGLGDLRKTALQNISQFRDARGNLSKDVTDIVSGSAAQQSADIDAKVAQEQTERAALGEQLGLTGQQLNDFITQQGQNFDTSLGKTTRGNSQFKDAKGNMTTAAGYSTSSKGAQALDDLAYEALGLNKADQTSTTAVNRTLRDIQAGKKPRISLPSTLGGSSSLTSIASGLMNTTKAQREVQAQAKTKAEALKNQLTAERGTDEQQAILQRLYGNQNKDGDIKKLTSGEDISRSTVSTAEDVSKYNALQDLLQGRNMGNRELTSNTEGLGSAAKNREQLAAFNKSILEKMSK